MNREQEIFEILAKMYPDAKCELDYRNIYEITIAVILSAQATDVSVNKVTPKLFEIYPDTKTLSQANEKDVQDIIKTIGLYQNKARNIVLLAKQVEKIFNGEIPATFEELISLSGVGRKSANVILSEGYNKPALAVDTHVERISKRLRLAKEDDTIFTVEKKLMAKYPKKQWSKLHHLLIFFGRYHCKAQNPSCQQCPLEKYCIYMKRKDKLSALKAKNR